MEIYSSCGHPRQARCVISLLPACRPLQSPSFFSLSSPYMYEGQFPISPGEPPRLWTDTRATGGKPRMTRDSQASEPSSSQSLESEGWQTFSVKKQVVNIEGVWAMQSLSKPLSSAVVVQRQPRVMRTRKEEAVFQQNFLHKHRQLARHGLCTVIPSS